MGAITGIIDTNGCNEISRNLLQRMDEIPFHCGPVEGDQQLVVFAAILR